MFTNRMLCLWVGGCPTPQKHACPLRFRFQSEGTARTTGNGLNTVKGGASAGKAAPASPKV